MKNKGEVALCVIGLIMVVGVFYALMPNCKTDQTLVRGLVWFECVRAN